jgi:hypothetical protein
MRQMPPMLSSGEPVRTSAASRTVATSTSSTFPVVWASADPTGETP